MVVAFALSWRLRDVPLRETPAVSTSAVEKPAQPLTVEVR